jgi:type I restriction enzyme S subunit
LRVPSRETQDKIVDILKSLDDKIEVNQRINENLEQQAQALFKSWFVDFEPFKDQPFVVSELGMIPEGWRVMRAEEVFNINIGKTPPRKEQEWFSTNNENNVWVSIADMGNCGVFISDSSEYLTDEAISRFNVLTVEKDTILLSFKLTVGRVAIANKKLTTNEAIARFALPNTAYREFLYLYLKQYKYGNLGSTSSIATAVNSKTIKGMKLLIPPFETIKAFSESTKWVFEKIRKNQELNSNLASLRDTLLPRLMSGELEVKDIEQSL